MSSDNLVTPGFIHGIADMMLPTRIVRRSGGSEMTSILPCWSTKYIWLVLWLKVWWMFYLRPRYFVCNIVSYWATLYRKLWFPKTEENMYLWVLHPWVPLVELGRSVLVQSVFIVLFCVFLSDFQSQGMGIPWIKLERRTLCRTDLEFILNAVVIDLRSAQVYCVAIFLVSQVVSLNFHRFCG